MKFYVYAYSDPSRLEEIYIGKGQGNRAYYHLKRTDHHPLTHRLSLMKKNGVQPLIKITPCKNEAEALLMETSLIKKIGRKDLGAGPLLNLTDGGDGSSGYKHTNEAKAKVSFARLNRTEETSRRQSEAQKLLVRKLGWKHSAESKALMSERRKAAGNDKIIGMRRSEEQRMHMSALKKAFYAAQKGAQ